MKNKRNPRAFVSFGIALLLPLWSCASAPAGLDPPPPAGASSIEEFVPQWRSLTDNSRISPVESGSPPAKSFGIEALAGVISEPPLEFWALRADLTNPRLSLTVGPSPKDGTPGTVPSTKVSSFVKNSGCTAGINANPFEPSTALEGEDRTVTGLAVSEGRILSSPAGAYDALVFYSAESAPRAAILNQAGVPLPGGRGGADTYADPDKHTVEYAVGGFYRVLENGEITGRDGARHPRSAAGLSSGGGILYLLVIDGRRSGSRGATEAETGQILRRLGAEEGLCFDGGGSSALVLGDGKSAVRVLNRPIHRFIPGVERAVAICLGISFH